jgi:hypothetical protein
MTLLEQQPSEGQTTPAVISETTIEAGPTSDRDLPAIDYGNAGVVLQGLSFIRAHALAIGAVSIALLVPCFWHERIEACDLGSHVYNAWLASLIEQGKVPGLYLVHQWNNVLFDILLTRFGTVFGWAAAERIVVSITVLIFFWGAFALISAASGRAAWTLVPALAMIAYGWTFNIGFFNYYLSLGLAFWSAALLWRGKGTERLAAIALMPLVLLAHPLGLIWLIGTVIFAKATEELPGWFKVLPVALGALLLYAVRSFLAHRYAVQWLPSPVPFYLMNGLNGVDQLVLGFRYRTLARIVFVLGTGCFLLDAVRRVKQAASWRRLWAPMGLYALAILATVLLPDRIVFPQYPVPFVFFLFRLSSISAVFALCILGCLQPRKWHFVVFSLAAVFFFSMMYQDTGKIDAMEQQAEGLVSELPAGLRVTATIWPFSDSRFYFIDHIVDRACVEKCFSYSNFEPSSQAYRIRVRPGSPIVSASPEIVGQMELGTYVVQPADLPLFQIYQCNSNMTDLCMHVLHAGERTGSVSNR